MRMAAPMLLVAAALLTVVSASNILVLTPLGVKSHFGFFGAIANTLADRGHQVTVIAANNVGAHPNITNVQIYNVVDQIVPNAFEFRSWRTGAKMFVLAPKLCVEAMDDDIIRSLDVNSYDLVFTSAFMNECFLSLLDNTEVPFIYLSPNTIVTYLHPIVGNVDFPSFVTMPSLTGVHPLTFIQRLINSVLTVFSLMSIEWFYYPNVEGLCKEAGHCNEDMTPLSQIAARCSMIFINSVRSLEVPARPYVPAVVPVGGLNCRPAAPLPQDWETWVENGGDEGFIYFSLGSAVKPSDMPEKCRVILVNVFRSLSQRVLWKWHNETMDDLPANVKLAKWMPQQDILGHPKLKLFISHGGLFSTFEATYHGVPVLGMPLFADQSSNIERVVSEGWGESVEWADLSEELFRTKILNMINNKRYSDVVGVRSVLMKDEPLSPRESVVYWTEYVIRHRGAPHLRSPVIDMALYRLYNMDVWASVLAGTALLVTMGFLLTKSIFWCLYRTLKKTMAGTNTKQQSKRKIQ